MDNLQKVKYLLTGATGFVGSFFRSKLDSQSVIFTSRSGGEGIESIDLINFDELEFFFGKCKPAILIHIAGNKDVNFCEKYPEEARKINVQATSHLVELCKKFDTKFIYLSTDYVFDGHKGNYKETDFPVPSSEYGKMKLESEKIIQGSGIDHIIIRSGALYGKNGKFYQWAVSSLKDNVEIEALTDSFFTPTLLDDLYEVTWKLLSIQFNGIVHIVGRDKVSRYQMIEKIAESLGISNPKLKPISIAESGLFFLPDLSLCPDKLNQELNIYTHSLKEGLDYLVKESEE
ncbi:SDR family oxidoreductase [Leptospira mtsangambouensis]|uniref:dTDP-4-dehydrorhamnose reductase n=1 Tax=Leptospira mtsangambouensis TaxID=2484912 RepID=A0ABY2P4S6_9LEPT|nr:SDR family oxidoreductase [Leptospira mtsangambouensis]TGM82264.1 SDR family oxidoreductase [Leptospira mtsangambouensis]